MQGSLVNRIMESSRPHDEEIVVGMGGTVCHYSDRSPVTVVAVRYAKDGKTVKEIDTRGDAVGPNKRVWPDQEYDITPAAVEVIHTCGQGPDPNDCAACRPVATWRVDGRGKFRRTYINPDTRKRVMASRDSDGLSLGDRDYYVDPSF